MTTFDMHDARTNLSRLVDAAEKGEVITIAKAGRPVAKLTRVDAPAAPRRLGFLAGRARIPDDFDDLGGDAIANLFDGRGA